MTDAEFDRVIRQFVQIDVSDGTLSTFELAGQPGAWLLTTLGLALACVGLGYRDGFWESRYLRQLDTRSADDMMAWDRRVLRAWVRRNPRLVPRDLRSVATEKLSPGQPIDEQLLATIAQGIDWSNVGLWGPGEPRMTPLLRRAQAMYVLTRTIAEEISPDAAFSFMIGANQCLFGHSPLTFVSSHGANRFEEVLVAADVYLSATI